MADDKRASLSAETRIMRGPNPGERTISSFAAGRRLGVFSSTVQRWVANGLLEGGKLKLPGRERMVWWISEDDLNALAHQGGRWAGIERRKAAQRGTK